MYAIRTLRPLAGAAALGAVLALAAPALAAEEKVPGLDAARTAARALLLDGDYDRAIAAYREILRQTQEDPQSYYDLAAALAFLRYYQEALRPAEEALHRRPDDLHSLELAADIYFHLHIDDKGFASTLHMAELGDVSAMFVIVDYYEHGRGVAADPAKALMWAERAAEGGHIGAMQLMEQVYREGLYEQAVDTAKADEWARRRRAALQ